MPRKAPTPATLKALFAKCGNLCAFPGCTHPIVDDRNLLVAEVCHINSVAAEEARFDPSLDDEYLRSYENLILLCHAHHRRIDALAAEFSVTALKIMRENHEKESTTATITVPDTVIYEAVLALTAEEDFRDLNWVVEELEHLLEDGTVWAQQPANRLLTGVSRIVDAQLRFLLLRLLVGLDEDERMLLLEEQHQWERQRDIYSATGIENIGGSLEAFERAGKFCLFTRKRIREVRLRMER